MKTFRWGYLGDTEGYAYGRFAVNQLEVIESDAAVLNWQNLHKIKAKIKKKMTILKSTFRLAATRSGLQMRGIAAMLERLSGRKP